VLQEWHHLVKDMKVTVMAAYHLVTCGLTACTPGSATGPTLGNKYEKNFTFFKKVINHTENLMLDELS